MTDVVEEWVEQHDNLSLDGNEIMQDGQLLGRDGSECSIGPDDGGVRGEPVEVDDEWLIVKGSQVCYVGEDAVDNYDEGNRLHDGMVKFTGKFAVRPWHGRKAEIDGPIPE